MLDTIMSQGLALVMGITLAAICGLRAFLPLLVISILSAFGKIELGEAFQWMSSWPAITTFSVAVVLEIAADKLPVVDHVLDTAGLVIKPIAASVAMAGMIKEFDPLLALVLSLVTGGLLAEGLHILKAKLRLLSSAATGTIANPILSFFEDFIAISGALVAWLLPAVGFVYLCVFVFIIYRIRRRRAQASG